VNLDKPACSAAAPDRKHLSINGSIPGLHPRVGHIRKELGRSYIAIDGADVEARRELLEQRLFKLIRQPIAVRVGLTAAAGAYSTQASRK
jgi:hypothetical protein